MERFKNQVAVISGGADGLGKGIAERIASEGGTVVLLDINETLLNQTVEDFKAKDSNVRAGQELSLRTERGRTEGYVVDVSDEQSVASAMEQIEKSFGKIDIMVNCAGIVGPTATKITDYPVEAYDKVYQVNLRGSFLMTKYALKAMEKRNYGRILLLASIAGKEGNPFMTGYSSMKAGVLGLVKGVGKEYANTGITINGLAPAVIHTALNDNTAPEQMAYMVSKIPMNRLGTVEEVAAISAWIVSKESSFNTGFIFDISGGRATY